MSTASLSTLWATCIDRSKDRVNNRSFWEAIERTRALVIDNDTLIVGLDSSDFGRATHILQPAANNTLNQIIQDVFGKPLSIRLIEGTTLDDWTSAKQRDERVAAMNRELTERQIAVSSNDDTWEAVFDQVTRLYAQYPNRALPQGKARYANEALTILVAAIDRLNGDNPSEMAERSVARAIDRIANAADIPSSVIAFELERLRASHQGKS